MPAWMDVELVKMTWLDDRALSAIAGAVLSDADQRRLVELGSRDGLSDAEREDLGGLRERDAKVGLRKACAWLHIEHIVLSARSGRTVRSNLCLLCLWCNSFQEDPGLRVWPATGVEVAEWLGTIYCG